MDGEQVPAAARRDRAGKRARRRPRIVKLTERDGYWHATGTLVVNGRGVRVRKSLGLPVAAVAVDRAQAELEAYVGDLKAQATGGVRRGDPVAVAGEAYLNRPRERPLGASTIRIVKEAVARFQVRRFNEIAPEEWVSWVDGDRKGAKPKPGRMTGRKATTRERFLNGLFGFLRHAQREHGLAKLPAFTRDGAARNPNRRARRRVSELRPDLIRALLEAAHIAIRAQLAIEWSTGARVSSVLHGVRVCDLILAKGREQITFRATKNGDDVHAALNATAAQILRDYVKWRGRLHDREAPLLLTPRRKPYVPNDNAWGTQNKTGFRAARRRAQEAILAAGKAKEAALRRAGRTKAADAARDQAGADAALIGKVTQHWFRHLLATRMRHDPRAAMEQGGWRDYRSVIGYTHDVPSERRELVRRLDDLAGKNGHVSDTHAKTKNVKAR